VWLWLLALQAQAQYRVDRWTTDDGLPQNSINSLVQTRDGYLWLTTNDGLVRFDGVRFTVFNKANTSAFFSNRLGFLHEDQSGRLWIYTEGGGLVRYENGSFTPTIKPGDPSLRIQSNLLDDGQGGIFLALWELV
jgi:ligand-binding sensor domain-containing protein